MRLTPAVAARFMAIGLGHVGREYPHRFDHLAVDASDVLAPRALHPLFFGSVDWSSCVHTWWTLLTCARAYPMLPEAALVRDLAMASFTPANVAGEAAYLRRPEALGFARGDAWAWLLTLHAEMLRHRQSWARALDPLAATVARRLHGWLAQGAQPVRAGRRGNTAFALIHAHAWATRHDGELALALTAAARRWYGRDAEPRDSGGGALLSPVLAEAHCMLRLVPKVEFAPWFEALLPELDEAEPAALFIPGATGGRDDSLRHGINLARAWSWRALGVDLPLSHVVHAAAERHLAAAMPHVAAGREGEHWLASFALLALLPDSPDTSA